MAYSSANGSYKVKQGKCFNPETNLFYHSSHVCHISGPDVISKFRKTEPLFHDKGKELRGGGEFVVVDGCDNLIET